MRAFFSAELMPAIHFSSFDCAGAVRFPVPEQTDLSRAGFIEQARAVAVGVEAVVSRAVQEKQHQIAQADMAAKVLLEDKRKALVALAATNAKTEADARAYAVSTSMQAISTVDARDLYPIRQ